MQIKIQVTLAAFLLAAVSAHAGPGALEINQACVAEGCFLGDAPGFPVTINQPGGYVLTSNITVSTENSAIQIVTNHVDLDMNGFSVEGPVTCTKYPTICSTIPSGNGIDGTALTFGSTIHDGTVSGFTNGIVTDSNWRIENVSVVFNKTGGIRARPGTRMLNLLVAFNEDSGISGDCAESGCSVVSGSAVHNNGTGIYDYFGLRVVGSTISNNTNNGILNINGGSLYEDNQIVSNGQFGVALNGGVVVDDPSPPVTLKSNTITRNSGGNIQTGAGAFIDAGGNVCGTSVGCP